jgi:hypothetical protein
MATVSKVLPTVADGGTTARLRQPLVPLPNLLLQSNPMQHDELLAEDSLDELSPPRLPLATVLISKTKQRPNRNLQHSEGDFNLHKINIFLFVCQFPAKKFRFG